MKFVNEFKNKTLLVVGDSMIDRYLYGKTTRISPEAPVPIVRITDEKNVLGGAANVANNISSLKAKVYLASVVGLDKDGILMKKLLKENNIIPILVEDKERPTTIKQRIISGNNHQLLRLDYERTNFVSDTLLKKLFLEIKNKIKIIDSILLSDYSKGLFSEKFTKSLIKLAKDNKIPIIVDGKPTNFEIFKGCTLITPNLKEASEMTNISEDIILMGNALVKKLDCNVFITRGGEGISIFDKKGKHTHIPPSKIERVFDVTGAGDTVLAIVGLCLASNSSLIDAAKLANYGAGLVIQTPGTSIITPFELENINKEEISHYLKESIEVKKEIIDKQLEKIENAAMLFVNAYKTKNKVIAFGNGGSAGDAQHLIGELVGRFKIERKGLAGLALTTDSSVVTAIANDYGYDKIFQRQIEANANKGDVVVAISTSGNSPNVLSAIEEAKKIGCKIIGLSGKSGGKMKDLCDVNIVVPSDNTPRIQEAHIAIIHILCELLDKNIESSRTKK